MKIRSRTLRQVLRHKLIVAALVFLLFLIAVAVASPWLAPKDPDVQQLANRLQSPDGEHLLGTDSFGRDTLSRLLVASRVTLIAAAQGLGLAIVAGIPLGLLAGYVGSWIDAVLSRIADGLLALPPLILALAIIGILGPGLTNAMIAIGLVLSPRFFRVARSAAESVTHEGYIEAARADGCSPWRVLARHVLPNASGPLLVQASFGVGLVITAEAGLSFLGLGVQPPQSSWGSMIREGFDVVYEDTFMLIPPTVMVVVTILAMFLLGDGLRDAFRGAGRGRT